MSGRFGGFRAGYSRRGYGFGFGRGGCGWGVARGAAGIGPWVPFSQQDEADLLRREAKLLENSLEDIKARLEQIEEQPAKDKK
jgi:hypothetical protein